MNHESLETRTTRAWQIGSSLRAWRRNGQWMLVVRVDAYTGWSNWDDGLEKDEDCRMKEMAGKMEAKGWAG